MDSSESRKRVVLLIADDWSPIGGCYGYEVPSTPRIDALAAIGTVFHRAYCTTPSCGPSRACILTGHHSYTHGQYGNPHAPSSFRVNSRIRPITRDLKQAGVRTGLIGKRHILPLEPFEFDFVSANEKVISKERTLDDLSAFFEIAGEDSFFLMAAPSLPHRTQVNGFDHPNYAELAMHEYSPGEVTVPDFLPDLPDVRQDLARYYSAITRFDEWVGIVLDEFKKRGVYDDTLFLILSDHGMPFVGAKASPFEGGHRCPLIAACPGKTNLPLRTSNTLVSWLDLAPTIAEWLDVPLSSNGAGSSLVPILTGTDEPREEVYLSHMFHGLIEYYPYRIVCRQRWKYVLRLEPELALPLPADLFVSLSFREILKHRPEMLGNRRSEDVFYAPAEALFDLENDPGETTNLVDDPQYSGILQDLRASMEKHREATADPMLPKINQAEWRAIYPRKA